MRIIKMLVSLCFILSISVVAIGQPTESWKTLKLGKQNFELHNVTGEVIKFQGKKVLKIERDLNALPFDANNLEATVDEPHYAKLMDLDDFENGTIEVKMYSQIQDPSPFPAAAGFIGLYFRITEADSAFESIYLRPKVGRINKQYARNHAVQYFSFPDYKFQTLRDKFPAGSYEGSAPVALNEWITMRLEINGDMAEMFVNDLKYSSFVVDKMLGKNKKGSIGLYVDIGTVGYFRDLKVTKRTIKTEVNSSVRVSDI
ncbi:MAG TPA: hypothetical protein VK169_09585 [Saprospiraceae bacterium]|nr:hypothetical protein [Saprospiraceae bacterium]